MLIVSLILQKNLGILHFCCHMVILALFYMKYKREGAKLNTLILITSETISIAYHLAC